MHLMFEVDYLAALWTLLKGLYHLVASSEDGGFSLLPAYVHLLSTVTAGHGLRLRND